MLDKEMIKKYRVCDLFKYDYSEIGEYIDENHTDRPLRNDEIINLLNKQNKRIKELEEEKEFWKSDALHSINLHSMLSFEIQKLSETKDVDFFLDFYYKHFCKSSGDD